MSDYAQTYRRSLQKPEEFWAEAAEAMWLGPVAVRADYGIAGAMSVWRKSSPLNSSGSPVARASA
jgi:hypothetical protein